MKNMRSRDADLAATGRVIAHYKALNGLSIPELAESVHCSQHTVRSWLRGGSFPSIAHLHALAAVFGVYAEDIVCFRDCDESHMRRSEI